MPKMSFCDLLYFQFSDSDGYIWEQSEHHIHSDGAVMAGSYYDVIYEFSK